jgi:P-type Cu+ transporter
MATLPPACACFDDSATSASVWWRLGAASFLVVNAMVLGVAANGAEATPAERFGLESATGCLFIAVAILLGWEFAQAAGSELRQRRLSMELLFLLGISASFASSLMSLLYGVGGTYFDVAALLLLIYSLGREVGRYGKQRALLHLSAPATATDIVPGQHLHLLPGRAIPADGFVLRGKALVQDLQLTGESFARPVQAGDKLRAGSFPLDASLWMEVSSAPEQSEVERVRRYTLERALKPGPTLEFTQRMLQCFVPFVAVAALGTFLFHARYLPVSEALAHAMSVLVIACPCALGFAAPLTMWSAQARLRQMGLLCRSGEALERMAEIDTLVFDKTGTLSAPEASAATLETSERWKMHRDLLLRLIAAAENGSGHPIARAMQSLWADQSECAQLESIRLLPGRGIAASVQEGAQLWQLEIVLNPREERHTIDIFINGERAARVLLDEELRDSIDATIHDLEADQMRVVLATGDAPARAARVPVREQHSRQSPFQKLALVESLQTQGRKVLFLGDGLNDGPAMASSHVGITVPSASPAIQEIAGLLNQRPDWQALPVALRVARQSIASLRRNVKVALAYNVLGMAVAAAGWLHPVAAAVLMSVSSLTVILSALNVLNLEAPGEDRVLVD